MPALGPKGQGLDPKDEGFFEQRKQDLDWARWLGEAKGRYEEYKRRHAEAERERRQKKKRDAEAAELEAEEAPDTPSVEADLRALLAQTKKNLEEEQMKRHDADAKVACV